MPKLFHTGAFAHTHTPYKEKLLDIETFTAFSQESFYTEMPLQTEAFTRRSFYLEKPLNRAAFTHTQKLLHREDFAQRSFFTDNGLREGTLSTNGLYIQQLSHTEPFARTSFYSQVCFHRAAFRGAAFTHRSSDAERPLHREAFTHGGFHTEALHREALTQRSV